ncbi:MAG TPA: hypothetical protein VKK79_21270 [Candidatus Lokiarchaeia archaeon]|nr:hypothetical protein [Candidatus Lokiarchaeia archaeon]
MAVVQRKYFGTDVFLQVYYEMIRAAQQQRITTYGDLARIMGLPPRGNYMEKETGWICGEVSCWENSQGRPMLSAVVVNQSTNMSGSSFFTLAQNLGLYQGTHEDFWQAELQRVYDAWGP